MTSNDEPPEWPPDSGNEDQGSDLPGYPSYHPRQDESAELSGAEVPQPPPIRLAVRLMRVGAGVTLLALTLLLTQLGTVKSQTREQLTRNGTHVTESELDTAVHTTVGVSVVISLVAIGLWLWMAHANGAGRRWARPVATTLGALGIFSSLTSLRAVGQSGIGVLIDVVNLGLAVVIVVLLWRRESSDFYAARSPRPPR
jgi:hypothetical protein